MTGSEFDKQIERWLTQDDFPELELRGGENLLFARTVVFR